MFVLIPGSRMLQHSNSANEMLLRRKLEEQQQAAELQQAIELQSRRLMGLQLLDLKSRSAALPTPIGNPFSPSHTTGATPTVESPPDSGTIRTTRCCCLSETDAVLLMFFAMLIICEQGSKAMAAASFFLTRRRSTELIRMNPPVIPPPALTLTVTKGGICG